jgi:hypothetical protein
VARTEASPALAGFAPPDRTLAPEQDPERPQQAIAAPPSAPASGPIEPIPGISSPHEMAALAEQPRVAAASGAPASLAPTAVTSSAAAPVAATPAPRVMAERAQPIVEVSADGADVIAIGAGEAASGAAARPPQALQSADASDPPAIGDVAALPVVPPLTGIDPEGEIESLLDGYECARVGTIYEMVGGVVTISGHLRSRADRSDLLARLSDVPGVTKVIPSDLHVIGEPYCQVLTFLDHPSLILSDKQRAEISAIGDPIQASVDEFEEGTIFERFMNSPNFESYIYVDYFAIDKKVYHLLPSSSIEEGHFQPEEQFILGGDDGRGLKVTIAPPFGVDLILAIGSSERLFPDLRPKIERAADYLTALASAIDAARQDHPDLQLEYTYHLVYTVPAE